MRTTIVAAVAAFLLAGCDGTAAPPDGSGRSLPSASSPVSTALFAINSGTLGPIVIDAQGYVLYRFEDDSMRPPQATCVGVCALQWLPVPVTEAIRVEGIDRQLVGEVRRPDGFRQVTLAGWPLYGHAGDRMPGDSRGHGAEGRWYAVTPIGGKAGQRGVQ